MASAPSVPCLFLPPNQNLYRAAVARIIRETKARHNLSNVALADAIGCSDQTVANAEAEQSDLSAVTLARLAYVFGEDAIAAYRALYHCAPREPETVATRLNSVIRELEAIGRETRG